MSKDYGSWSVADLKNELRRRNAKVGGKKAVLVQRIFNFNRRAVTEDQAYTNKCPFDAPKLKSEVEILTKSYPTKINERELEAKDKGPLRLEAKVLHYLSPSLFYVSLVHQQIAFLELFEKLQKHDAMNKKPASKTAWAVGDRCGTICAQSQTWRRAELREILPGNIAKVFYCDFASFGMVSTDSLHELPDFATIGDAAIKCHLCGIATADGSEQWPGITKEYFKELLDAYKSVFITKLGDFKNKSMPVEMWVYHTTQGGALEPDVSEWRCLNKRIVEQGLGVPHTTQPCAGEAQNTDDDMMLLVKNVNGSGDEWLELKPLPTKPINMKSKPPSPQKDDEDVNLDLAEACSSSTVFVSDWLPPKPLLSKAFTAMPTHIDDEGVIFLHAMEQQTMLQLLRKALDSRYPAEDPEVKDAKWTAGEPCMARFFMDHRFYRGRVLQVDEKHSTCTIQYVDFGNEEECQFKDLRKSITLYQIPIQANKCVLARIRPVKDKWDPYTLDYIHKSIVEKQCFVKVKGNPSGGIMPVDIKLDELWINDHLVEFGMAAYSDVGSESDPDYILCNDSSQESINGDEELSGKAAFYPPNDLEEFDCCINVINNTKILQLAVIHDHETNLLYQELFAVLQDVGYDMTPLDGVFINKACIALYHEDNRWYRASILQYNESESRVKVRYVDYGNQEIITLADIREITEELMELPPATVCASLHGIAVNPHLDIRTLMDEYAATFLEDQQPFHAKVIAYEGTLPCVQLINSNGQLVYDNLIKKGVFIRREP